MRKVLITNATVTSQNVTAITIYDSYYKMGHLFQNLVFITKCVYVFSCVVLLKL